MKVKVTTAVQVRLPIREIAIIDQLKAANHITSRSDLVQKAVTAYLRANYPQLYSLQVTE